MKTKQILLTIIFLFSTTSITAQKKLQSDLNNMNLDSLFSLQLNTDTNNKNKEFVVNFNKGMSLLNESISLADDDYHPFEEAEKIQTLIITLAGKSKMFLEKALQTNGRDKNTIIALYFVARLLSDLSGTDRYIKLYESLD